MKHLAFVFAIMMVWPAHAQNCTAPASSIVFQQKLSQLSAMRTDQQRLHAASEFARRNCLLTYQVKQITELFADDVTRLNFVQDAYPALFDKENAYDLYDVFAYFSTVMRFHDFINGRPGQASRPNSYPAYDDRYDYPFPEYNYPSYDNYREPTPCSSPLSESEFNRLVRNVMLQPDDELRELTAIQLAEANCMTVSQIMKMASLLEQEANRLDYLKRSYDFTYDVGNYHYSNQLFKDKTYYNQFETYVTERRRQPRHDPRQRPGERHCGVSDSELLEIVNTIKGQSFDNTQLTMAKQIVRAKQSFTTSQIRQLVDIFTFEASKLDMAKYCYAYCIDQSNYYKINTAFTFSSSVDELTKYIGEQP